MKVPMQLLGLKETLGERQQHALDEKAAALAALVAAQAAVEQQASVTDETRLDAEIAARQARRRALAAAQERLDLAVEALNAVEDVAHGALLRQRQQQATEALRRQSDAAETLEMISQRLKALDEERSQLLKREQATKMQLTREITVVRELQRLSGLVLRQIGFTHTTRDEVPAKYPMRLSEWQRLWDGVHVHLRMNGCSVTTDMATGRIVRLEDLNAAVVPGFEHLISDAVSR